MKFLSGYKTYIFAACIVLSVICYLAKWIDAQTFQVLLGIFGAGAFTGLRLAIKKLEAPKA